MHTLSNETHEISTSDNNKSAHNADAAVYLDRTACSCSNPFLNKQEGREKKKMPSKLLKSKFPVIKRLLFLFFFFFHGLMKTYLPHILRFCSKVFF